MVEENNPLKRNSIQCLSINSRNHVKFYDECKLQQNKLTRHLIIMTSENEEEYIYVAFDRTFVRHNDILCIDACVTDSNKYAVIFRDAEQCERFIESLNKRKDQFKAYITVTDDDKMFRAKFLIPVAKQFEEDPLLDPLQSILERLLEYYQRKCQDRIDKNVSPDTVSTEAAASNEIAATVDFILNGSVTEPSSNKELLCKNSDSVNMRRRNLRQRPRVSYKCGGIDYSDDSDLDYCNYGKMPTDTVYIENNDDSNDSVNDVEVPSVIDSELDSPIDTDSNTNQNESNVSDMRETPLNQDHSKLTVVGNARKRSLRQRSNISYQMNENYMDYGSDDDMDYGSAPKKNRKEIKSMNQNSSPRNEEIYPSNFKFINYIRMGNSRSRLFIFPNSSSNKCYEYFYDYNKECFVCCGCNNGKWTHAIIKQDSEGKNYVKCLRTDHVCTLRKFEPEKYKTDLIIKKPNYKEITDTVIVKGRKEKKTFLLLFTSADQKRYYKLQWDNGQNLYACMDCTKRCTKLRLKSYVQACVRFDADGNEFVYVRNQEHVCSKMKYIYLESDQPTEGELTTFKVPERQWIKRYKTETNVVSTIVKRGRRKAKVQPRKPKPQALHSSSPRSAKIVKIPNTPKAATSKCSIKKRKPRKSQILNDASKIVKSPNFQFYEKEWRGKMYKKLAAFLSNDKKMCYEYTWSRIHKRYICTTCSNHPYNKFVSAKVMTNESGEEFIQLGANDHGCNMKKFVP